MSTASRLTDTPAGIITELGETLRQTPLGVALTGDTTRYTGPPRSIAYRWFTDPTSRVLYHSDDHALHSRVFASGLRNTVTLRGPDSWAAHLRNLLLARSEEFRTVWNEHEVGSGYNDVKRLMQPEVGALELTMNGYALHRQMLPSRDRRPLPQGPVRPPPPVRRRLPSPSPAAAPLT
ncbi:hypothetical protein ABZ863_19545 [Saccharomonospora sp. NPDC046836]|uniref:MmyB family transcriptional regulator n=1 Tax=Saccharomonospora sp. NPDC046836 TaxID=3156921 RepID=UPI0033CCDABF